MVLLRRRLDAAPHPSLFVKALLARALFIAVLVAMFVAVALPHGARAGVPVAIGSYQNWAAFRGSARTAAGANSRSCYAIAVGAPAAPSESERAGVARPYLLFLFARGGATPGLYAYFPPPVTAADQASLSIGDKVWPLAWEGARAQLLDAGRVRAVIDAIRRGREAWAITRGRGARAPGAMRVRFDLAGAPSAIDAAALDCLGR